jgi:hypothetical protein
MILAKKYLVGAMAVLAVLLVSCNADGPRRNALRQTAETFVPQDASDKRVVTDLPWVQISFVVRRPWLVFAVDEHRIAEANNAGWRLCRPVSADWEGYEDDTVTPSTYRRQRIYVLYKDGISVQLIGLYDRVPGTNVQLGNGETPIQQGIVIARATTQREALQTAANFKLACEAAAAEHRQ